MPYIQSKQFEPWRHTLKRLLDKASNPTPVYTLEGAIWLGRGMCSQVYGFGPYALKIYQKGHGLDVQPLMIAEIETYLAIAASKPAASPRYYDHQMQPAGSGGAMLGWLLMDALPGRNLSPEELAKLPAGLIDEWSQTLIQATIDYETCIAAIEPLPFWNSTYADVRLRKISDWHREGRAGADEFDTAQWLCQIIATQTQRKKYLHGDFNHPNIMTHFGGRPGEAFSIGLIDPIISFDAPEANWRHFTIEPELAERLAAEYARNTGDPFNPVLVFAIGALTHLFIGLVVRPVDSHEAVRRANALVVCLERLERLGHN